MPTPRTSQLALGADGLEHKAIQLKITDEDKGLVEAVFCTFMVIDHDGDVIDPKAIKNGIETRISAYGHRSHWGSLPVGRGTIRTDDKNAVLEGQFFLSTAGGRETFETIKQMGNLQQWSWALGQIETGRISDLPENLQAADRYITAVEVPEVSPVLLGSSIGTETLSVKNLKRIIPSHSTAVVDEAWSASTNVARIPNDASAATLRKMYAWVDPEGDAEAKSSYKFPHHMVSADGNVGAANVRGCIAGIGVLNGARGGANIPDSDRQGVWNHLARHIRAADMEPAELRSLETIEKESDVALRELARFEHTRTRLLSRR